MVYTMNDVQAMNAKHVGNAPPFFLWLFIIKEAHTHDKRKDGNDSRTYSGS